MRRSSVRPLVSLIAPVLLFAWIGLFLPGSDPIEQKGAATPAPTEHVLRKDAEKENRLKREEWIESLHRAAPGTDWRAIERATRAAQRLERESQIDRGIRTGLWTEIGSANLAGRTHVSAYNPADGMVYVGSSLGGVWRGTINGDNWTPLSDALGLGSHGLVVVPGDPEVIVTITDGGAYHATTNGGVSWFVPTGLPENVYACKRILRDVGQPRTVYLLVRGAYYDGGWVYGFHLCRSEDGGQSFERVHTEPSYNPECDIWTDRVNPGPLYLMRGEVLKISYDQGDTFTDVGSAPDAASNVILTGSEAGAPTLYAALRISNQWKLYRSADAGANWTFRYNINDFWLTLVGSITNPDLVYFAGVECFRSDDGGVSFQLVNNWWDYYGDPENKLHADHPGGESIMIDDQEVFFLDTDGGTYVSYDGLQTVQNISLYGLGISQYYGIFTSQTDPYLIAAGSQDQGFQVSLPEEGMPYLNFVQTISGDYGHLTSTVRDHNWLYSVYPGFVLVQRYEEYPSSLTQVDFPAGANYQWMPFILADPTNAEAFYLCADHLWHYERGFGGIFYETELPQDFSPGTLSAFAISDFNPSYQFAVTTLGKLWWSHNGGATWNLSETQGPGAHYFYGTAILTSPTDPNVAWVGGSGYSAPAVWKTTDGGVTWVPMNDGLPSTLVFGLVMDNSVNQNLFAAAEAGPFRYDADTGLWEEILGTDAPLTTYWCLESVPELEVIRYGTYGRGIWDYRVLEPAAVESEIRSIDRAALSIFPNPAQGSTNLSFELAQAEPVRLEIFNVEGRRLATPVNEVRAAGRHDVSFDLMAEKGYRLENGIYLVRLTTESGTAVEKLQIVE